MNFFRLSLVLLFIPQMGLAVLPANYQKLNASNKQSILWKNITESQYKTWPTATPNFWKTLYGLLSATYLNKTFNHVADELPPGRSKIIHPYGSVAKVSYQPQLNNQYTGIFQNYSLGLLRLSHASSGGNTPGMGLKFFVDGKASANIVAMPSLDGQGEDYNFFAKNCSTTILPPSNPIIRFLAEIGFGRSVSSLMAAKLDKFSLPLNHLAKVNPNGTEVEWPRIPQRLIFKPTPLAQLSSEKGPDFRVKLKNLPVGTPLYEVYGVDSENLVREIHLGTIKTTSEFMASEYGDSSLFFQHDSGPRDNNCSTQSSSCPFGRLF